MMQEINTRNKILNSLKSRNIQETGPFFKLIKSQNRLFELNNALKNDLGELKVENSKLHLENIELHKNGGGSSTLATAYPHEKFRQLDEQLLNAKDEVIRLQKNLVDQAQQVILLNKQLKEKNDELSLKEMKIVELENKCEAIKRRDADLENQISSCEESIKLWRDEKVEAEVQYNCLVQKYDKLKEEYESVLSASLRFREEQIEKVNKQNELDSQRLRKKLRDELEMASKESVSINI